MASSKLNVPEKSLKRPVSQLYPKCLMRKLMEACDFRRVDDVVGGFAGARQQAPVPRRTAADAMR